MIRIKFIAHIVDLRAHTYTHRHTKNNGDHFRMWWENNLNTEKQSKHSKEHRTQWISRAGESELFMFEFFFPVVFLFTSCSCFIFHSPIVVHHFYSFVFFFLRTLLLQNRSKKERHIVNRFIARTNEIKSMRKRMCRYNCIHNNFI